MKTIRRACAEDAGIILPLVREYWTFEEIQGFQPDLIKSQLIHLLSKPALGAGWLALTEPGAAGYLLVVYVFSLENFGMTAEIDEFFVLPQYRKQGTGKVLLETVETEFRKKGLTNISLQLSRENNSARKYYLRRGYRERLKYELMEKDLC